MAVKHPTCCSCYIYAAMSIKDRVEGQSAGTQFCLSFRSCDQLNFPGMINE